MLNRTEGGDCELSLGERKKRILKAIVEEYIEHAEPVGSKSIAARSGLDLSSATIRNEMAELEAFGLLEQPHVSAGRIPSQAGYRLYVNELMHRYKLTVDEMEAINESLRLRMQELESTVQNVSRIVSQLTHYTTLALVSDTAQMTVRKFDVVLVDRRTVIVVLVTNTALVKNKYMKTELPISEDDVLGLVRLLNERFANRTLEEISISEVKLAERSAGKLAPLVAPIVDFAAEIIGGTADVYVGGASNILRHPEYRDPDKAQRLLDYLSDHHDFSRFARDAGNLHVTIGSENLAEPLQDASIVFGSYGVGDHLKGVIGVIGPTRMDYARVAANLNYFISGFNKLLERTFLEHPDE